MTHQPRKSTQYCFNSHHARSCLQRNTKLALMALSYCFNSHQSRSSLRLPEGCTSTTGYRFQFASGAKFSPILLIAKLFIALGKFQFASSAKFSPNDCDSVRLAQKILFQFASNAKFSPTMFDVSVADTEGFQFASNAKFSPTQN